jgi:hypothetical protein
MSAIGMPSHCRYKQWRDQPKHVPHSSSVQDIQSTHVRYSLIYEEVLFPFLCAVSGAGQPLRKTVATNSISHFAWSFESFNSLSRAYQASKTTAATFSDHQRIELILFDICVVDGAAKFNFQSALEQVSTEMQGGREH